jgi:hypothetical protein
MGKKKKNDGKKACPEQSSWQDSCDAPDNLCKAGSANADFKGQRVSIFISMTALPQRPHNLLWQLNVAIPEGK